MVVMVARRRWRRRGRPVPAVAVAVVRRRGAMPPGAGEDRSREGESGDERDHEFLGHGTPSFLFWGLVSDCANNTSDDGRSENGPAVRLVMMLDVDGLAALGRRRCGMPSRCRVVRRCAVVRDLRFVVFRGLGAVLFGRLRGRSLLVSGHLAAARSGSRQRRGAEGRAGDGDGRDLDDVLVHVTPFQPFRAILPLHQERRMKVIFLTGILRQEIRRSFPLVRKEPSMLYY